MSVFNPGTDPVPGALPEHAEANVATLVEDLAERELVITETTRDESADGDGRFGYRLHLPDGRAVAVRMPGAPLNQVQDLRSTAPCLYVNDVAWWWRDALGQVAGIARGKNLE